jgi:preprotein translocase SecE subunit
MDDVKKYIDFSYLMAGVLFVWLGMKLVDSIWRLFGTLPNPEVFADVAASTAVGLTLGVGVTVYLRVNEKIYTTVTECGVELKKTMWPDWATTKQSTLVVIVVTFILGFSLWMFDATWKTLTDLLYKQ